MKLPTLYHEGRTGKMYQWVIHTEGADIVTEYGTVEGEKTLTRKTVKGKNIGKSNETTPEEQATSEAQSMWQKKRDKKYRETLEKAQETVFLPMLAHDYTKLKKPIEFPVDVQPKLDGVRCLAHWQDDRLVLMSRGGKEYDVKHIANEVAEFLPKGSVLDGELYVHGMPLQDIIRLVKKHRDGPEGSIQLEYKVYDGFHEDCTDHPWNRRKEDLQKLLTKHNSVKVSLLPFSTIESEEAILKELEICERQGFEGVILRKHKGEYNLGHRSRDLLKLKNFQDAEFEITGWSEATGNDKGTVVWTCTTGEQEFSVRPIGTREQRREYFENAADYIGRFLTVKYQALTKDGIPQFPVGIAIREDL